MVVEVEVISEFRHCPRCGSTRRMMEELGKEMKEEGLVAENMDVCLDELGGPAVSPDASKKLLGQTIKPGMFALRDICIDCGELYVVKIMRKPVLVSNIPVAPFMRRGNS